LWAASYLINPVYVAGRYDMVAFPAYVLLMGLGLTKCVRIPRVGLVVGPIIGALLFTAMGAKLLRYYEAESDSISARDVASWISTTARSGDVVVVTQGFGLPVLYFLIQSGYQRSNGYCSRQDGAKRFAYRQYPLEIEKNPLGRDLERVRGSREEVRKDLRQFLARLDGPDNVLWLVVRTRLISKGKNFLVPGIEYRLVKELEQVGFRGNLAVNVTPLILRFHRPKQSAPD